MWEGVQGRRPPHLELSPRLHPGSHPAPRTRGHCPAAPRGPPAEPQSRQHGLQSTDRTRPGTRREEVRRGLRRGHGQLRAPLWVLCPPREVPLLPGPEVSMSRANTSCLQNPGAHPPGAPPGGGMSAQPLTREGTSAPRHRPCGSSRAGGGGGPSLGPPGHHCRIQACFAGGVPTGGVPDFTSDDGGGGGGCTAQ